MDRNELNFAAAVLCGIGSFAALVSAVLSSGPRKAVTRADFLSALFGLVGSIAWAASARDDMRDAESIA
ncbi:MAG: hypothetical protein QNJ12_03980 [Ilumatobacter sp.]|uniref:hypothetical protein n=1 Tax=Ilumatobacter sp. TaxID=1967498 RepID=UPI00261C3359|nr:hypothetical protein [Ilumatobacter sp.]MDJ0767922.1 hypothetical protein [Ilumatobacter sp.]